MKKLILLALFISSPVFSAVTVGPIGGDKAHCERTKKRMVLENPIWKAGQCVFYKGEWFIEVN